MAEIPNTLPKIPNALPRSSSGNASPMNAPPTGNIPPHPKPCIILPIRIISIFAENAISAEPTAKNSTSRMKIFLRP